MSSTEQNEAGSSQTGVFDFIAGLVSVVSWLGLAVATIHVAWTYSRDWFIGLVVIVVVAVLLLVVRGVVSAIAGSFKQDVQLMAGHSNLNTTQRYIEADAACQRRVVELV